MERKQEFLDIQIEDCLFDNTSNEVERYNKYPKIAVLMCFFIKEIDNEASLSLQKMTQVHYAHLRQITSFYHDMKVSAYKISLATDIQS